ncbi:MAG: HAMP domain-containing histidine kinase [Chitinophagaceae bacterium]|nr:HAMP domain-containing histidine kinase [Bacteroidota bacterium]TAJ52671.1 MAG: HAMP domain-containing histidine kinase [Chitinophagaceae bacterium]
MKRTFPVIVILISLSLCGLIILQVSWFKNLLEVTRNQFDDNLVDVGKSVSMDLSKSVNATQVLRLPRRGGLTFSSEFHLHVIKPPTVQEKFTPQEVHNRIRSAMDRQNLKHMDFEFAVTDMNDDYEMLSKNFGSELYDTVNNRRLYAPILPNDNPDVEEIPSLEHLIIVVPDFNKQIWASLRWVMFGAIVFMVVIIAAFYVTVKSLLNQKKLSEIKSDFINNMTHEFKTPLATISLAVDALRNEKVQSDKEKAKYFSNIIKEENIRMNKHVETILQAALMEKQELQLNLVPLQVHEVIQNVLENYQLQLKEKDADVQLLLNAKNDMISADEVHFTNLVSNLIDNAIKYSNDKLRITISTHSTKNHVIVRVADNGIGMSKESVKRIFEKFYRAHTGNLHNVKGFGLGMSYVKTVIDAHKGKIKVESTPGKGTSFTVEMPLMPEEDLS